MRSSRPGGHNGNIRISILPLDFALAFHVMLLKFLNNYDIRLDNTSRIIQVCIFTSWVDTMTEQAIVHRRRCRWTITLLGVAILVSTAVACSPSPSVPVPELDSQIIDIAGIAGNTSTDVLHRLGEPSARRVVGGEVGWEYAIRSLNSRGALRRRAGDLRIEFSDSGVVSDWYFLDPRTSVRLPITETLAGARQYLARICRQPIAEVDLEAGIRRGRTTTSEIVALLEPVARYTRRKETATTSGIAWDYDVDRPSPVFIPPFYVEVHFGGQDVGSPGTVMFAYAEGYGGCK